MKIILASASPRRKELLGHLFKNFTILPAKGEETAVFRTPDQYVQDLARHKALEIVRSEFKAVPAPSPLSLRAYPDTDLTLVLGADTIVYAAGQILGKPADASDAFHMLTLLSGQTHNVYTGVCMIFLQRVAKGPDDSVIRYDIVQEHSFSEKTQVMVDQLSKQEIKDYIATGDPLDKAGSYGIQGPFSKHITGIRGDYYNVVGLPVSRIYRQLGELLS